jgi:hypothetical protein
MKIRLEGHWVCSVCGAIWENYYGLKKDEYCQCASCGARPGDDFPDDVYNPDLNDEENWEDDEENDEQVDVGYVEDK